ncbi:MAG TPA: hypothetical protein VGH54_29420 [Mycobacterium sp.]|uniref:hypothetical protein n=1 Tax=Mycobacterium sp. TaxID=1785 RepID=UPI002F41B212
MTQIINLPAAGEVLIAGDDLQFAAALTYQGSPLNLGSVTSVTAVLKQTAVAADASGVTYTVGHGLTVTNCAGGQLTWNVPRADVGANRWYRIFVTDTSARDGTALAGRLTLTDG